MQATPTDTKKFSANGKEERKLEDGEVSARYNELATFRNLYLQRARDAAKLTLPYIIPPFEGANASTQYSTPWQSVGARGTNNLASKLLLALFPPNACFLRMQVLDDPQIRAQAEQDPTFKSELESALSAYEDEIQKYLECSNARPSFFEAFKQLIIAGNCLIYASPDGEEAKHFRVRVYRLDHYVVKRSPNGKVLEIIAKETTTPSTLSEEVQVACKLKVEDSEGDDRGEFKTVDIYTRVLRSTDGSDKFIVYQEINGCLVPGSDGSYPAKTLPWIALRWAKMDNEDYGRGFIEEYIGDLRTLNGLSQASAEAAAIMAKMIPLVKPGASLRVKDLTSKGNGEPIIGDHDDVKFLQVEKFPDLKFVVEMTQNLISRLEQCFLLNTSIQRQAERVTAEEIKYMASELEDAMGGLYSLLSQELQLPFAYIVIDAMTKEKKLPKLPKGVGNPCIITGMEALGRGQDLQKLSMFIQGSAQDLGPGVVQQYVNFSEYFRRKATALAIDPKGLIKTDDEVQQAQQQQQQAATMQKVAPQAVAGGIKHSTEMAKLAAQHAHENSQQAQTNGSPQ